jgi:hypothetical protein
MVKDEVKRGKDLERRKDEERRRERSMGKKRGTGGSLAVLGREFFADLKWGTFLTSFT